MNNLGSAYRTAGKLDLAVPLLEEALKLMKAKLGPQHPNTLSCMSNLGLAYQVAGKLDQAVPLFEETLRLTEASLGHEHPSTILSMANLGEVYRLSDRLDQALPLLEEALKLGERKLGHDDQDMITIMNNLALAFWQAKRFDKSIPMLKETLKRREAKLGRQDPQTLQSAALLGWNYKDAGRLTEALPLLEEGHLASKKDPSLRWVNAILLDGYVQAGKTEQAVALAKELLAAARTQLPRESPQFAGQLAETALALLQVKAFTDAEPLLRESLAIREKTQPDDWKTFNNKSMLGGAALGSKEVRRGRAAAAGWIRRDEAARGEDPAASQSSADPGPGAFGAA